MTLEQNTAVRNPWHQPRRPGSGYYIILSAVALVLVVGLTVLSLLVGSQVTLADGGGDDNSKVAFTKWITSAGTAPVLLNMEGVVSGAVGGGKFVGEVLDLESTPAITKITALYHINGGTHQFTARVQVTQDNNKGIAVIDGVVTEGWLKGASVEGGYQVISPCGIINAQKGTLGDVCFQGTLRLLGGSHP